jgi:hypothetical protein
MVIIKLQIYPKKIRNKKQKKQKDLGLDGLATP